MNWFNEDEIGKLFKIYLESGEVSEGKLIQIGEINIIELANGKTKRFKNSLIASSEEIESFSKQTISIFMPTLNKNAVNKYIEFSEIYKSGLILSEEVNFIVPKCDRFSKCSSLKYEIIKFVNILKNVKKINELDFKFNRTYRILIGIEKLLFSLDAECSEFVGVIK